MDASDYRSAKQIRETIGKSILQQTLFKKGKIFFIDEIDGLFGREDTGGIKELISIIKESKYPIILAANKPYHAKLKSLRNYCELVGFGKISVWDIEKRLKEICTNEKIVYDQDVLRQLARMSSGDLRSAINDLEIISAGKSQIVPADLEKLSSREREKTIFDALKIIFKTKSALGAKLALNDVDKDFDEIFWWIESNITNEYEDPEELANAFDALSKADLLRRRIQYRQNWRLQSYMIDMMTAGVATAKKQMYRKFVKYQYPSNIATLGRTKSIRAGNLEIYKKFASYFHCSVKKFKSQILPYMRIMLRDVKFRKEISDSFGIDKSEMTHLFARSKV